MTSATRPQLRFAAISFVCVAVLAGITGWGLSVFTVRKEHDGVVRAVNDAVIAPVAAVLDAAPTQPRDDTVKTLDALTQPQIRAGSVTAVLVEGPDGFTYQSGAPTGAGQLPLSAGSRVRSAPDGRSRFVVTAQRGGAVIEVEQLAAPIESRLRDLTVTVWSTVVAIAVLLYAALQACFLLAIRSITDQNARLVRLYLAGEDLRRSLDLQDVLTQLARDSAALGHGDYALVALFDAESNDLIMRTTYDRATHNLSHVQRPCDEWLLRRAVVTKTPIVAGHASSAYAQFIAPGGGLPEQLNVLCAPMCLRDTVVGAIAVVKDPTKSSRGFSDSDIKQVVDLASQAAMAVEQAQLFAKVRAYAQEVELSYDSTLKALMAALDAKDEVTEGHCERVARLTVHLARELGVEGAALVDIERGALLHDVGKIGVPDAVLKKPAALNDREWEAMRKHPLLAGVMVSKVDFLEGATPILLYHHERWDGGGYPFGLSGENIPLEARVFSIVDAYDAMTSHRPYREAMTHEQAMLELRANVGSQFDLRVFEAFERLMANRRDLHAKPSARRDAADGHDEPPRPDHEHDPSAKDLAADTRPDEAAA